jgi:anti-sigma factor RsiW
MTCTEFLAKLDDLIDGNITAAMRTELEQHLHKCGHCEVVYNTTRKTIEIYRSHEIYELPTSLRDRLHSAIMNRCKKGCGCS